MYFRNLKVGTAIAMTFAKVASQMTDQSHDETKHLSLNDEVLSEKHLFTEPTGHFWPGKNCTFLYNFFNLFIYF